jgi:tetratricopeptide (TPR) repeat protein
MLQQLVKTSAEGDPNRSQYLFALASIYKERLHNFQREVEQIARVSNERNPSDRPKLAKTREADEKRIISLYAPTVEYFAEASRDPRYPRREDALVALAQLHLTMGNYPEATIAVQALGNAFRRCPHLPYLELRLADLEARDGKYDDARTRYLAIRRSGDLFAAALALYQYAWLEIGEGERQAAVRLLLEAEAMCGKTATTASAGFLARGIWQDLMSEHLFDAFGAALSAGPMTATPARR